MLNLNSNDDDDILLRCWEDVHLFIRKGYVQHVYKQLQGFLIAGNAFHKTFIEMYLSICLDLSLEEERRSERGIRLNVSHLMCPLA